MRSKSKNFCNQNLGKINIFSKREIRKIDHVFVRDINKDKKKPANIIYRFIFFCVVSKGNKHNSVLFLSVVYLIALYTY